MALLGHSVQFGFGCKLGQNIFLWWLPIYWVYRNFRVYVIWASVIPGFKKKKLVGEFVVDLVVGCPFV